MLERRVISAHILEPLYIQPHNLVNILYVVSSGHVFSALWGPRIRNT